MSSVLDDDVFCMTICDCAHKTRVVNQSLMFQVVPEPFLNLFHCNDNMTLMMNNMISTTFAFAAVDATSFEGDL